MYTAPSNVAVLDKLRARIHSAVLRANEWERPYMLNGWDLFVQADRTKTLSKPQMIDFVLGLKDMQAGLEPWLQFEEKKWLVDPKHIPGRDREIMNHMRAKTRQYQVMYEVIGELIKVMANYISVCTVSEKANISSIVRDMNMTLSRIETKQGALLG